MLYNIDEKLYLCIIQVRIFLKGWKRLPYPCSAWFLKFFPLLQKSKSTYYCHSYFFSTEKARLDSTLQGQRCLVFLCVENEEQFPFDLICSNKIKMV